MLPCVPRRVVIAQHRVDYRKQWNGLLAECYHRYTGCSISPLYQGWRGRYLLPRIISLSSGMALVRRCGMLLRLL